MTRTINPGKQRLSRYNADIRTRQIRMAGHVSKELRAKAGRSISIRVGDTVKILRGDYKGKSGSVTMVDAKRERVYIQGIQRKKADGKEAFIAFRPSKLLITSIDSKDKMRLPAKAKARASTTADATTTTTTTTTATTTATAMAKETSATAKEA